VEGIINVGTARWINTTDADISQVQTTTQLLLTSHAHSLGLQLQHSSYSYIHT